MAQRLARLVKSSRGFFLRSTNLAPKARSSVKRKWIDEQRRYLALIFRRQEYVQVDHVSTWERINVNWPPVAVAKRDLALFKFEIEGGCGIIELEFCKERSAITPPSVKTLTSLYHYELRRKLRYLTANRFDHLVIHYKGHEAAAFLRTDAERELLLCFTQKRRVLDVQSLVDRLVLKLKFDLSAVTTISSTLQDVQAGINQCLLSVIHLISQDAVDGYEETRLLYDEPKPTETHTEEIKVKHTHWNSWECSTSEKKASKSSMGVTERIWSLHAEQIRSKAMLSIKKGITKLLECAQIVNEELESENAEKVLDYWWRYRGLTSRRYLFDSHANAESAFCRQNVLGDPGKSVCHFTLRASTLNVYEIISIEPWTSRRFFDLLSSNLSDLILPPLQVRSPLIEDSPSLFWNGDSSTYLGHVILPYCNHNETSFHCLDNIAYQYVKLLTSWIQNDDYLCRITDIAVDEIIAGKVMLFRKDDVYRKAIEILALTTEGVLSAIVRLAHLSLNTAFNKGGLWSTANYASLSLLLRFLSAAEQVRNIITHRGDIKGRIPDDELTVLAQIEPALTYVHIYLIKFLDPHNSGDFHKYWTLHRRLRSPSLLVGQTHLTNLATVRSYITSALSTYESNPEMDNLALVGILKEVQQAYTNGTLTFAEMGCPGSFDEEIDHTGADPSYRQGEMLVRHKEQTPGFCNAEGGSDKLQNPVTNHERLIIMIRSRSVQWLNANGKRQTKPIMNDAGGTEEENCPLKMTSTDITLIASAQPDMCGFCDICVINDIWRGKMAALSPLKSKHLKTSIRDYLNFIHRVCDYYTERASSGRMLCAEIEDELVTLRQTLLKLDSSITLERLTRAHTVQYPVFTEIQWRRDAGHLFMLMPSTLNFVIIQRPRRFSNLPLIKNKSSRSYKRRKRLHTPKRDFKRWSQRSQYYKVNEIRRLLNRWRVNSKGQIEMQVSPSLGLRRSLYQAVWTIFRRVWEWFLEEVHLWKWVLFGADEHFVESKSSMANISSICLLGLLMHEASHPTLDRWLHRFIRRTMPNPNSISVRDVDEQFERGAVPRLIRLTLPGESWLLFMRNYLQRANPGAFERGSAISYDRQFRNYQRLHNESVRNMSDESPLIPYRNQCYRTDGQWLFIN